MTVIEGYRASGTHSARPDVPPVAPGTIAIYDETDTGATFIWRGSQWELADGSSIAVTPPPPVRDELGNVVLTDPYGNKLVDENGDEVAIFKVG